MTHTHRTVGKERLYKRRFKSFPFQADDHLLTIFRYVEHRFVNEAELAALRGCVERGTPYGDGAWTVVTAKDLGLESSLRPRGRLRKPSEA